ncbi:L-type lectin-domain containing receptor kinase IX.1 [Morella rubra]|uniref:L-type lectin-domain containing receptor kinase IX.1 n=1 Tax=Morella rubra TaxID=262757 RepID=A0A6A1W9A1_9ROSI|nr:L-type lectin-domain containing receptor kinase IX.1 [Morella rubra]
MATLFCKLFKLPLFFVLFLFPFTDSVSFQSSTFDSHASNVILYHGDAPFGGSSRGDGLAFFLAPAGFEIPQNSGGEFLVLFNTTTSTVNSIQNQIVLVKFDSVPNPQWDPPFPHVGINENSLFSSVDAPWNVSLHSGDTIVASILYNATVKNLSVSWTNQTTATSQENTSLSYNIDLSKVLPEWVKIGFSAAVISRPKKGTK